MLEACEDQPAVYLFVTCDNEAILCESFSGSVLGWSFHTKLMEGLKLGHLLWL